MAHIIDVIKYEGDNSTFVWKHPREDFYTNTQLIVHESQEAIFFLNGQALDSFGPGRYSLETQNLPFLKKHFEKLSKGETAFHCEVYFINKTVQMELKWGTPDLIHFIEPTYNLPLGIGVSGSYNLAVEDARKLLVKVIGTMSGIAWSSETDPQHAPHQTKSGNSIELEAEKAKKFAKSIQTMFRPLISTAVKTHLPTVIKENNIDLIEIDSSLDVLAEALRKPINAGFEEYGLTIPQFYVTSVNLPEGDPNFKKFRELHSFAFAKRVLDAEAEMETKMAEIDAKKRIAKAEIEASVDMKTTEIEAAKAIKKSESATATQKAYREAKLEEETTETELAKREFERSILQAKAQAEMDVIAAQAEAQRTKLGGFAEAEVQQAKAVALGEEMRAKGYTEKDVLQAGVQRAYAEALGNINLGDTIGDNVTINGGGAGGIGAGGMVGDMVKLGLGMAVAGKVAQPMHQMISNFDVPGMGTAQGASCPKCGASVAQNAKFCPECGEKMGAAQNNEVICPSCGQKTQKGKFCQECGAALVKKCASCGTELTGSAKFCPSCGEKQ